MNILNEEKTMDKLIEGYSIARYGDGEIMLCNNRSIGFQNSDKELCNLLCDLVSYKLHHDKLLIGLPPQIFGIYDNYPDKYIPYWKKFSVRPPAKKFINKFINKDKIYASSFITRITEIKNKNIIIEKFKQIWKGKKVVYLISERNKIKLNNKLCTLFDNAKSIEYYYIPHTNAWDQRETIINELTKKYDNSHLILCSAGPTATVLAYNLTLLGYQFIDIGHYVQLL